MADADCPRDSSSRCHIHKLHLDRRRSFQHRRRRFHRVRVQALLAVGQAHGRADFVLCDVLEFLQMLASVVGVSGLLICPRQSKLRRTCSGLSFSAWSNASIACGNCFACTYAVPRKYQVSASFASISMTRLNASIAAGASPVFLARIPRPYHAFGFFGSCLPHLPMRPWLRPPSAC